MCPVNGKRLGNNGLVGESKEQSAPLRENPVTLFVLQSRMSLSFFAMARMHMIANDVQIRNHPCACLRTMAPQVVDHVLWARHGKLRGSGLPPLDERRPVGSLPIGDADVALPFVGLAHFVHVETQ